MPEDKTNSPEFPLVVESPDESVTDPESEVVPVEIPDCKVNEPECEPESPLFNENNPLLSAVLVAPDCTVMDPDVPLAAVPDDNTKSPDLPA